MRRSALCLAEPYEGIRLGTARFQGSLQHYIIELFWIWTGCRTLASRCLRFAESSDGERVSWGSEPLSEMPARFQGQAMFSDWRAEMSPQPQTWQELKFWAEKTFFVIAFVLLSYYRGSKSVV